MYSLYVLTLFAVVFLFVFMLRNMYHFQQRWNTVQTRYQFQRFKNVHLSDAQLLEQLLLEQTPQSRIDTAIPGLNMYLYVRKSPGKYIYRAAELPLLGTLTIRRAEGTAPNPHEFVIDEL